MKLKNKNLLTGKAYINGQYVDGGKSFTVTNPANGENVAEVADLDISHTQEAIDAAQAAFPLWAAKSAKERADILRKWFDLIVANADDLAQIMTEEQGKPLAEARGEIMYGASFVEWYAEEAKRAYGDTIPPTLPGTRITVIKQPIGVCGMVTPWNFPSAMITRKAAPALAAGCTFVLKPAEDTPLSATALAVLAEEAGFPAGVFNIVTTNDAQGFGETICADKRIRKISFTGSTEVGKILMRQSADTVKKLSLELGGNAPFIVFEDADIDTAVAAAVAGKFRNSGEACTCINRLYLHENIFDEFAEKFTAEVKGLKVGAGTEDGVRIGPMINQAAIDKIERLVKDAVGQGADVQAGGKPHDLGGLFYEPTVLTNVNPKMRLSCEEIFGPVAPLFSFKTEEEVIALANDTEYGLGAYFCTRDYARSIRVAEALESGMVAINSAILSTEVAPFGGVKESGVGREGSRYGLDEFMEMKYVLMAGLE